MNMLQTQMDIEDVVDIATVDQQIELLAKDYELVDQIQSMRKGEILCGIRDLHSYKRDEGGFEGFVESRLSISRATAYNHIQMHEKLSESVQRARHISDRAKLQIAAAEPDIRAIIEERVAAGEVFTAAQVKDIRQKAAEEAVDQINADADAARRDLEKLRSELTAKDEKSAAEVKRLQESISDLTEKLKGYEADVEKFRRSLPKPEKAKEQAAETGGVVLASDGKFHSGSSAEQKRMVDAFMNIFDKTLDLTENPPAPERVVAGCSQQDRKLLRDRCERAAAYLNQIRSLIDAE
ncbi:hypothetical protein N5C81_15050 [Rhizobium pusense]|uniref:hypothetical protein n=1 Tax=Agrobacterium pusense TaxID=648995 RepID=UPI0024498BF0|nr:hypothetical protein [Agrobacterium pusense]MDH1268941.1 hypothetical protein [Agrobacterium pusense]